MIPVLKDQDNHLYPVNSWGSLNGSTDKFREFCNGTLCVCKVRCVCYGSDRSELIYNANQNQYPVFYLRGGLVLFLTDEVEYVNSTGKFDKFCGYVKKLCHTWLKFPYFRFGGF